MMKNKSYKYVFNTFSLLLLSNSLFANDNEKLAINESGLMEWILNNLTLVIGSVVILGAVGAIFNLFNKLLEIQKIRLLKEKGLFVEELIDWQNKESWWSKTYKNLTRAVPVEKEKDVMLDHDYDGIKELDNVLPPWWVATFYVCIVFAFLYVGYWHFSDYGYSTAEEYDMEIAEAEKSVKAYLASRSDMVDETNVEVLVDDNQIMIGAAIFNNKCISCHGANGEGNSIGPNLTDKYWIHGPDIKTIFKTIKYGVPEKGMISWKSQLRPSDMQKVASYILSLQGTNPPNPKEPQGELYETTEEENKIGMK